MIENVRKRRDIKLIVTEERRKKLASEPNYASCTVFSDDLMTIEMRKTHIVMNKPIMVGQGILDKSKELMYKFYYKYLKPKFKDRLQLLYMGTDSFVLEIETEDFFEDTKGDLKEWFDNSYDDKDMIVPHEYTKNASVNKKVIGKMKNELGKGHMTDFVAISPKLHAYKQIQVDGMVSEVKKLRGTSKIVTRKALSYDHYMKCLFGNKAVKCTQYRIKSTPMSADAVEINKIALKNSDNNTLKSFNVITIYPDGTNAFKVCFEELEMKRAFAAYLDSQK